MLRHTGSSLNHLAHSVGRGAFHVVAVLSAVLLVIILAHWALVGWRQHTALAGPRWVGGTTQMIWASEHRIYRLVQWLNDTPGPRSETAKHYPGVEVIDRVSVVVGADSRTVGVSYWLLASLASPLPIVWLWWFRKTRRKLGACPGCGYDLRASIARCPECGREIKPSMPSPSDSTHFMRASTSPRPTAK